jgi:beta-carotene 15,15'-dioxygenase
MIEAVLQTWILLALCLSLGMAHGAMDILLLLREKQAVQRSAAYGAAVVVLAAVLAPMPAVALLLLLVMSVWHFGEQNFLERSPGWQRMTLRLGLGGASVMWPVLLSPTPMQTLLSQVFPHQWAWLWPAWRILAWLWVAVMVIAVIGCLMQRGPWRWLFEVASLAVLYVLLTPVLAFSVYFGLYHSVMHIWRMLRISMPSQVGYWLWAGTLALTWLALAALAWRMQVSANLSDVAAATTALLPWLIVALAAVTLPHLMLVGRAQSLLYQR